MAIIADDDRINLFYDVRDEEHFKQITESQLIDVESTYLFFNSTVRYYLLAGEKPTPSSMAKAVQHIAKEIIGDNTEIDTNKIAKQAFGIAASAVSLSLFNSILPIVACGIISGFLKNKK